MLRNHNPSFLSLWIIAVNKEVYVTTQKVNVKLTSDILDITNTNMHMNTFIEWRK